MEWVTLRLVGVCMKDFIQFECFDCLIILSPDDVINYEDLHVLLPLGLGLIPLCSTRFERMLKQW